MRVSSISVIINNTESAKNTAVILRKTVCLTNITFLRFNYSAIKRRFSTRF